MTTATTSTIDRNCISHWFPRIEAAGLPVPRTAIIETDVRLASILDGQTPDGWQEFIDRLGDAADAMGYPCFLRTGQTSNKHDWLESCRLPSRAALPQRIGKLIEFSECCGFIGLPYRVWAVREMLPTAAAFHAFAGAMPIVREFRCFVADGSLVCLHPYWPADALVGHVADCAESEWRDRLAAMHELSAAERRQVVMLATAAGKAVGGEWSVDVLATTRGWFVTDMAVAAESWHWPQCKANRWATSTL